MQIKMQIIRPPSHLRRDRHPSFCARRAPPSFPGLGRRDFFASTSVPAVLPFPFFDFVAYSSAGMRSTVIRSENRETQPRAPSCESLSCILFLARSDVTLDERRTSSYVRSSTRICSSEPASSRYRDD